MHSLLLSSQINDCGKVHHALYRVTMLSCMLVVPPQDQGVSAVPIKENISTPLPVDSPLQQTTPRALQRKMGIRDLRAAFRKLQRQTASSSSTNTNDSSASTLSTDPGSLLSVLHVFESAHSVLMCSHDGRESVADRSEHIMAEAVQHSPASTRLRRKTALENLRSAFKFYDHTLREVSSTPFVSATYPAAPALSPIKLNSEAVEAGVALAQADRQPVYISLPLPPPLHHEEVVADIPFVPRPLTRGVPVHGRARAHADLTIPHIWRGRSTRYH